MRKAFGRRLLPWWLGLVRLGALLCGARAGREVPQVLRRLPGGSVSGAEFLSRR